MEAAKVYNVLEAKLKHAKVPLSIKLIKECPDLKNSKEHQVRDCLRNMTKRGLISRVPIFEGRDRVGYKWGGDTQPDPVNAPKKAGAKQEEVRLRINPDKSITILTTKFKVTIEVPE